MGLKGLGGFQAKERQQTTKQDDTFFKLKEKGAKAYIRPLVELDETSVNYSEKNGVPLFTQEFANPQKFWLTIEDTTEEEGNCVGWDMLKKYGWYKQKEEDVDKEKGQHSDPKFNWNPNQFVYLPVLVKDKLDDEPRVEIMRLKYRSGEFTALREFAEADRTVDDDGNSDDPYASITTRWWTYARNNGEGFGVRYSLTPRDPDSDVDVEDYEVPDLESFVNKVPYAEQAKFLRLDENVEREDLAPKTDQSVNASSDSPKVESAITKANW